MISLVTVEQMREIEKAADAGGISYDTMMDHAGKAAAERALQIIKDLPEPRITILIGTGNNGGDGLVAGRYIAESSVQVNLYLLARCEEDDPLVAAAQQADAFLAYGEDDKDHRVLRNMLASSDLIVDALFGIGVRLPIKGGAARVLKAANQALNARRVEIASAETVFLTQPQKSPTLPRPYVLAIDCPSGLDCDTGAVDKNVIPADETITFIAPKVGLVLFPGAASVGHLTLATLGITELEEIKNIEVGLVDANTTQQILPARSADSNKGTFGKSLILAGSINYSGAAALTAMGAYRSGTGLVTVGAPGPVVSTLASKLTEPTWLVLPHDLGVIAEGATEIVFKELEGYDSLLIGPGWGKEEPTKDFLTALLSQQADASRPLKRQIGFSTGIEEDAKAKQSIQLPPLVVDADALNLLAQIDDWWTLLPANTVITPHPGEMSRLCKLGIDEIQSNRRQIVLDNAKNWNVIVVLKGAHTVIAAPDGQQAILPFKTDALATAGTGDVLAGLIVGFLAQGMQPYHAAVAGGYVHGLAGELASQEHHTSRSVTAGDVLAMIPEALGILEA